VALHRRLPKRAAAALGILAGQIWHTGHRPDLPSLTNQDPSALLGDPSYPHLKIVLLGDSSITAPGVEPLDDCWARRIGHRLAEDYEVELVSVAVGGSRASDLLKYQVAAAVAEAPDMALVCVGANDALRSVAVSDFERDLTEILTRLSAHIPAVGVSGLGDLGPLPRLPSIGRAWARVRSRSFDRAIARVSQRLDIPKTLAWGPMWDDFDDPENERGMYAGDMFHASGRGHALFAQAWADVIDVLVTRLEPALTDRREHSESSR
jgi:lysophospholipase L1-like esterase